MNTMTYMGYSASIDYSEEDECFVGHLVGIPDIVGFDGASLEEAAAMFHEAVDGYLAACEKLGQAPNLPMPGQ